MRPASGAGRNLRAQLRRLAWEVLHLRRMNAADVADELRKHPILERRHDQEKRWMARNRALIAADEKELVREIRAVGYRVTSVYDLWCQGRHNNTGLLERRFRRRFSGDYPLAYPILARHLLLQRNPILRAAIAWSLLPRDTSEEHKQALLTALRSETDAEVRVDLASVLLCSLGDARAKEYPEIGATLKR